MNHSFKTFFAQTFSLYLSFSGISKQNSNCMYMYMYAAEVYGGHRNIIRFDSTQCKPTSGLLQILSSDWMSYPLSIGDRPVVVVGKGIDFQIENNGRKLTFCRGFSSCNNILSDQFVYTKTKQTTYPGQLGCVSLTICFQTTQARCLIVK